MPRGFILFLAIALATLSGFQFFLYFSVTRLLGIDGRGGRRAVMAALTVLLAGAIASMFLQRSVGAAPARAIAGGFQLSLAVGLNLGAAFVLAWAAWGSARMANARAPGAVFGWSAVALAALVSIYGVWNATQPRVERLTVRLKGLPEEWRGRTIAQISDLHLGFSVGPSFAGRVVRMVNAERPAAVAITGDLFDGGEAELDSLAAALIDLDAPMGVYFVTGNHETYVGVERVKAALSRTRVRMLDDEMAVPGGLQIAGISYPERGEAKEIGAAIRSLPGFDPGRASVLLFHSPERIAGIRAAGVGLLLCGHTHRGQLFPFQYLTRRIYGRYDRGLNVEDGFAAYTSAGTGTWGPRMRTSARAEIAVIRLEPDS